MAEALLSSDLAVTVIYSPQGRNDLALPALVGSRDVEGSLGEVRARQDIMIIEVRVADLEDPGRDDRFELDGVSYVVASKPGTDDGIWWRIAGYRDTSGR